GSDEILLDDSVRMAERMRAAGCQVELEIWPRMPHTWQVWARVLPEARAAIERIGAFVQSKVEPQAVRWNGRAFGPGAAQVGLTLRIFGASELPLVGFNIGRPYHFAPLLGLVGDELAEVAGRAWKHSATKVGKSGLDLAIGEAGVDLSVELNRQFQA